MVECLKSLWEADKEGLSLGKYLLHLCFLCSLFAIPDFFLYYVLSNTIIANKKTVGRSTTFPAVSEGVVAPKRDR